MPVTVRFMANAKDLVDRDEVELHVDAAQRLTARDVLLAVGRAENRDLSGLLRAGPSGSWGAVRVVRNGRMLYSLDEDVTDGDVLVIVPLLGAG